MHRHRGDQQHQHAGLGDRLVGDAVDHRPERHQNRQRQQNLQRHRQAARLHRMEQGRQRQRVGQVPAEQAADVAQQLNVDLGRANVGRFSDGEVSVELQEHVRGRDIFVLQSTCAPTNDNLMEMLVMVDALKRASAGRITATIPYFGYARQDRRSRSSRVPIAAKLVANMLVASGVDRVLTMDLHAEQIQGFFDIPVDNIYALPILLDDIRKQNYENPLVVSPDHGGVVRARSLAKRPWIRSWSGRALLPTSQQCWGKRRASWRIQMA